MRNREILRIAANVARMEFCPRDRIHWNPLDDDAEALRLSIRLGIGIEFIPPSPLDGRWLIVASVAASANRERSIDVSRWVNDLNSPDVGRLTRRCIVLCAIEIAKWKKEHKGLA